MSCLIQRVRFEGAQVQLKRLQEEFLCLLVCLSVEKFAQTAKRPNVDFAKSKKHVGVSHGSRQPSFRFQVLPKVCYIQG
jgi:hypothetical protein